MQLSFKYWLIVPPVSVAAVHERMTVSGPAAVAARFVGAVGVDNGAPVLNAAKATDQTSEAAKAAVAATGPATVWLWSSLISLEDTRSLIVKLVPAVKLAELAVAIAPSSRSPLAVVVTLPLFGDVLMPCAAAGIPSSEFVRATPEYSRMAKRSVPEMVSDTVMVLGPAVMFSA